MRKWYFISPKRNMLKMEVFNKFHVVNKICHVSLHKAFSKVENKMQWQEKSCVLMWKSKGGWMNSKRSCSKKGNKSWG